MIGTSLSSRTVSSVFRAARRACSVSLFASASEQFDLWSQMTMPWSSARAAALAYLAGVPLRVMLDARFGLIATTRVQGIRGLDPVDANRRLASAVGEGKIPVGSIELPTDVSYGSFTTEPFRASAEQCPLCLR